MVGGGDRSAQQPVVCGGIGHKRIIEARNIDAGHGDGDRVCLGRVLGQVVEGQHRLLIELAAQGLGGVVQRGFVDDAQMKLARPFKGCPL